MGGQGIARRDALRFIGIASVAASFPGFCQWTFACSHNPREVPHSQSSSGGYKPLFFSPRQFQLIERLAEMIIPGDDTPGAKEAGVAEFIDFMVANRVPVTMGDPPRNVEEGLNFGSQIQARFLTYLGWLNAHAQAIFSHEFLECSLREQNSLLEELAYQAKFRPGTEMGRDFFALMRDYTVVGYYTTKIGLQSLGYPGLRTVWPGMPGCTHSSDPEHARLHDPGSPAHDAPIANN
jgi:gluconate 2-dehydrogenase gamma chain